MNKYLGTKIVEAEYYEQCRSGRDEHGNLLLRPAGYIVKYPDGYESWSPKDVFEKAYRRIDNLTFGLAIEALKQGFKVARKGWNGKGQYVELASNISYVNANKEIINCEHDAIGNKALVFVGTSGIQMGWLASQSDMLAEDWQIVE